MYGIKSVTWVLEEDEARPIDLYRTSPKLLDRMLSMRRQTVPAGISPQQAVLEQRAPAYASMPR